jgi:hypothetical protein
MPVTIYTLLPQIQDESTRQTVRLIADALTQLSSGLAKLQSQASQLSSSQLSQIQKALSASGTNPLPLTGLPGGPAFAKSLSKISHQWIDSYNSASGTFTQSQPQVADLLGEGTGFGSGAAGTAVTTTLKGAGTGPTTPQTVVQYLKLTVSGTDYYLPLMQ